MSLIYTAKNMRERSFSLTLFFRTRENEDQRKPVSSLILHIVSCLFPGFPFEFLGLLIRFAIQINIYRFI